MHELFIIRYFGVPLYLYNLRHVLCFPAERETVPAPSSLTSSSFTALHSLNTRAELKQRHCGVTADAKEIKPLLCFDMFMVECMSEGGQVNVIHPKPTRGSQCHKTCSDRKDKDLSGSFSLFFWKRWYIQMQIFISKFHSVSPLDHVCS